MLYLGCPQWSSTHWKGRFFSSHCQNAQMLSEYAQIFNSVEGNTSFYAAPKPSSIQKWRSDVPDDFKFTFKVPKRFSHELALQNCQQELRSWLTLFEPMFDKIGQIMLQLPKACGPEYQHNIENFCQWLPSELPLGIEIRHLGFFDKADNERRFNQFLMAHQYNRIMMDTRPLFSELPSTPAIIDAQSKKPKVPLHVIATGNAPVLRYVGCSDLQANRQFYAPWLKKINLWLDEGKTPYVFFHTADNYDAPLLAKQFVADLNRAEVQLGLFPALQQPQQTSFL
ncbi:hypothetical protein PSECIP111854_00779 [Pseudoalteromonas sp. CIP111854]|uniref:DUF72 domain-containing protein n=1 Tax=Pseudoalteromonas holothuriae TaxID=2963714 RepID=A0A9W4W1A0_9GAMM|nr:DUF72 domain-containing protein [Pseudoalteromonas sp. CIP111854]CAH9051602.1 hypothetical protein PSECIP111854_00779 [Pseudoalteromonas sp. CIP111854]